MGTIVTPIVSLFAGAVLAGGTIFGLVSTQTSSGPSPADSNNPVIDYGSNK